MSILFPFFISVVMFVGEHGTMVPDRFGPFDTQEEAELAAMFLRYQAGMETGPIERHWRWINATTFTPEGTKAFDTWQQSSVRYIRFIAPDAREGVK